VLHALDPRVATAEGRGVARDKWCRRDDDSPHDRTIPRTDDGTCDRARRSRGPRQGARGRSKRPRTRSGRRSVIFGLSVEDDRRLGLCRRRRAERANAVEVVLTHLPELRRLLRQHAGGLPRGEQQMVALGRVFGDDAVSTRRRRAQPGSRSDGCRTARHSPSERCATTDVAVLFVEQHVHTSN
jgi:hypothetical protein